MEDPQKSLEQLSSTELIAEEILRDRLEIVALDKRRNSNREALRALTKIDPKKSKSSWIAVGPILVKMPTPGARSLLEKDRSSTETEINKLRSDLKVKVNQLRDAEFKDPVPGMNLNPLSRDEMNAVGQILGRTS